jgi:D-glycero-alpha-D-manno-heptose 1-phosphate guanylyltransferase
MTTAVVLAGGLGTRLRSVVPDLPKPMAPVRGRPFLEHLMDYWIGQGVRRFVLSIGYRGNLIQEHFGTCYRQIPVEYSVEETPLGTGGALLLAARNLAESFVLLNGDTFFEVDLESFASFHHARGSRWTFALFRTSDDRRYMGMEIAADGRVLSLRAQAGNSDLLANGGVYLIDPAALVGAGHAPPTRVSMEDEILPSIAAAGCALYGMECRGRFIDIGIPDDYTRAARLLP